MAKGISVLKHFTIEEIAEFLIEDFGVIRQVSKKLECSANVIYDLLDTYPELQEARKKGMKRKHDYKVETCEEVLQKLLDKVEEDPDAAAKQAQFILKNIKNSPYNADTNKDPLQDELENARRLVNHTASGAEIAET